MNKFSLLLLICFSFYSIQPLKAQYALDFDGNNGYVDCGYSNDFNMPSFTIECRIRTTNIDTNYNTIISNWQDSSGREIGFWIGQGKISGADLVQFWIGDSSSGGYQGYISSNTIIADGQWHMITARYTQGLLSLVVDGVFDVNAFHILKDKAYPFSGAPLTIGNDSYMVDRFKGEIDEIRVWNIALNMSEIELLWDSCLTGTENGLLALYTFDEGSGKMVMNRSMNKHHGTIKNMDTTNAWAANQYCGPYVGMNDAQFGLQDLRLYPNPCSDKLHLSGLEKSSELIITDQMGRVVLSESVSDGNSTIDVRGVDPGMYIVRLGKSTHKIFVDR